MREEAREADVRGAFARVLREGAKLAFGRGLSAGLAILRMALVAQLFGAAAFGQYSLLQAYGMLGVVVIELGLKTVAPRRAAANPAEAPTLTTQIAVLQLGGAVVLAAVAALSPFAGPAEAAFLLAFFLAPALTSAGVVRRGLGRSGLEARLESALAGARLVPLLAALVAPLTLEHVYVGTLVATVAVLPLAGFRGLSRPRTALWRSLLREGAPLVVAAAASQLFARIDLIVLGWFHPDEEVAVYSAAALALHLLAIGAAALAHAAVPWFARLRVERGTAGMLRSAVRRSAGVVGVTFAVAAVAGAIGPPALDLVVGIRPGWDVVVPVALSAAPAAGSYWLFMALASAERGGAFVRAVAMALAANVLLDLAVIPRFASTGAGIATLVSETALLGATVWIVWRVRAGTASGTARP
jgi:O-antigen/teichoic acid export membrane protein